eukprot:8100055-Alexandrium_andersonii.AAC.1
MHTQQGHDDRRTTTPPGALTVARGHDPIGRNPPRACSSASWFPGLRQRATISTRCKSCLRKAFKVLCKEGW